MVLAPRMIALLLLGAAAVTATAASCDRDTIAGASDGGLGAGQGGAAAGSSSGPLGAPGRIERGREPRRTGRADAPSW